MTQIKSYCMLLALSLAVAACGDDASGIDEELGPVDGDEGLVTFADRIDWPGIDRADGREIPFIRGFGEGGSAAYWFLGFASRRTADSFWFCREGDTECPLDANRRLNWDHLVGHPVFTRIRPGGLLAVLADVEGHRARRPRARGDQEHSQPRPRAR